MDTQNNAGVGKNGFVTFGITQRSLSASNHTLMRMQNRNTPIRRRTFFSFILKTSVKTRGGGHLNVT